MHLIFTPKHLLGTVFMASVLVMSGCEPEIEPLEDAPEGTLTIGTEANEVGSAIVAKPGGGYIAAIATEGKDWDSEILELDPNGNILDRKKFEITGEDEVIRNIKPSATGGYLATSFFVPADVNVVEVRLRVLDNDFTPISTFDIGEIQTGVVYSNGPQPSHVEAFDMVNGGWIVTAHFGFFRKVYRVDQLGEVVAQRSINTDFFYPVFPLHNYAQIGAGRIIDLEVVEYYPEVVMVLESLDDNGYVNNAMELKLDSFSIQQSISGFFVAALDYHANGRLVASIYQAYGEQYVFEFDFATGQVLWIESFSTQQHFHLLAHDNQGNQYFAGNNPSNSYGQINQSDCTIGKVDSLGQNMTRRSIGGKFSENLMGLAIGENGQAVAIGSTASFGNGGFDVFLVFYP